MGYEDVSAPAKDLPEGGIRIVKVFSPSTSSGPRTERGTGIRRRAYGQGARWTRNERNNQDHPDRTPKPFRLAGGKLTKSARHRTARKDHGGCGDDTLKSVAATALAKEVWGRFITKAGGKSLISPRDEARERPDGVVQQDVRLDYTAWFLADTEETRKKAMEKNGSSSHKNGRRAGRGTDNCRTLNRQPKATSSRTFDLLGQAIPESSARKKFHVVRRPERKAVMSGRPAQNGRHKKNSLKENWTRRCDNGLAPRIYPLNNTSARCWGTGDVIERTFF